MPPVTLIALPSEPSSDALKKPYRIVKAAHDTAKDLLSTFDRPAGNARAQGPPTAKEQDLLRSMLIFAGAGLDSSLKLLIRAAMPLLFVKEPKIETKVAEYFSKIEPKSLAIYILKVSPRDAMLEDLINDLTGSSLQSPDELERVIGFLNLDRQKIIGPGKNDRQVIKAAFDTRNNIIHELDVNDEPPAVGVPFRVRRTREEMVKQTNVILKVAFAFLDEVSSKLAS
jgi:hypothetical protein